MRASPWSRRTPSRRRFGTAVAVLVIALVAATAAWLTPPGPPIEGKPCVIDGDTLRIGSTRIRLSGIDAPELDQTCATSAGAEWSCGIEARDFVERLVRGDTLSCQRNGRDRYGRALARCTGKGADIAEAIVAAGWATAEFAYLGAELGARNARLGIWEGTFMSPADWRRSHGAEFPGFWEWIRGWFQ